MRRSLLFGTLCASLFVSGAASAQTQPWLSDRRFAEGKGIEVGDFEFHPGIATEVGYDSNWFYRGANEDPVGSLRIRVTPHASIGTLGAQRRPDAPPPDIAFRAGISATYDEFVPVSGDQAGQDAMASNRNVGGRAEAAVDFFPGQSVFGSLRAGFTRNIQASNVGLQQESFNRMVPDAGAEIGIAPGGGLLDWRLGYNFVGNFFESDRFSTLNNFNNEISTRGRWRFLPRSAVTFDGRFGFISYTDATQKTDSHPMRARIGYNGLVTNSFAVLAMVGWGASFYTPTPQEDFDSVIGQAEVKWLIAPPASVDPAAASLALSSLAIGFTRDFSDSFLGTYENLNRGYAKFSYLFAGRFLVIVDAGGAALVYPNIPAAGITAFTAGRIDASAFAEYRFTDYLGVNANVRFDTNLTDVTTSEGDELKWQRIQAYLGARAFW
jgi:hypothetical protein